MGFRAGTASTWPTWAPTVRRVNGSSSLVFRVSPESGMVFLSGSVSCPPTGQGTVPLSDSPAPAAFRPRAAFDITTAGSNQTPVVIDTDGNLVFNPNGQAANYGGGTYRSYYFTDTPTP